MFLRLPRKRTDALTRHDTSHSHWKDVLQLALDGVIPSDERLENFLDRYERMP